MDGRRSVLRNQRLSHWWAAICRGEEDGGPACRTLSHPPRLQDLPCILCFSHFNDRFQRHRRKPNADRVDRGRGLFPPELPRRPVESHLVACRGRALLHTSSATGRRPASPEPVLRRSVPDLSMHSLASYTHIPAAP